LKIDSWHELAHERETAQKVGRI